MELEARALKRARSDADEVCCFSISRNICCDIPPCFCCAVALAAMVSAMVKMMFFKFMVGVCIVFAKLAKNPKIREKGKIYLLSEVGYSEFSCIFAAFYVYTI